MSLPSAALAARRMFAAASHSGHEGGGQCVFTLTFNQTQPRCIKASRFRASACNCSRVMYIWSLLLNINCGASSCPAHSCHLAIHQKLYSIISLVAFHSEDVEDTDHCVGLAWCWCLHCQRLHKDAGTLTWATGICAIFSPAYPHQGEPQTACTHILLLLQQDLQNTTLTPIKKWYRMNINDFFPPLLTRMLKCLLPEISLGRWQPLSVPQLSCKCSAWRLRELPSLRGSVTFVSCVSSQLCTWLNYTDRGAKKHSHIAVHPHRNKTNLCCITMSAISFHSQKCSFQ